MTNDDSIQKQGKGLNIFEKYLTIWVGLCIVGGIVLGKVAPAYCRRNRFRQGCSGSRHLSR